MMLKREFGRRDLTFAQKALEARRPKFLQSAAKVRIAASQSVVSGTPPSPGLTPLSYKFSFQSPSPVHQCSCPYQPTPAAPSIIHHGDTSGSLIYHSLSRPSEPTGELDGQRSLLGPK